MTNETIGRRDVVSSVVRAYGDVDLACLDQLTRCLEQEHGSRGVLCADHHLGYSMPIGGVVAYQALVSPSAVGFDIACGNAALCLGVPWRDIARDDPTIGDRLWNVLSFGIGRRNATAVDSPIIEQIERAQVPFQRGLLQLAAGQLGTIGGGNHYVNLMEDVATGLAWVAVHFGSRGFGHKTAKHFMAAAGSTSDAMDAPPLTLPVTSDLGDQYLAAMSLAGRYAYAGRDWVVERVAEEVLGRESWRALATSRWTPMGDEPSLDSGAFIHCHHNFAWYEKHGDRGVWVHRKGATPAHPSQVSFVGATMRDWSAIIVGQDTDEGRLALASTAHGAGRVMSRTDAKGKRHPKTGAIIRPPRINWDEERAQVIASGVQLFGADADEAPGAYKDLDAVLAAHGDSIRVVARLRPRVVMMAAKDEIDPFKD